MEKQELTHESLDALEKIAYSDENKPYISNSRLVTQTSCSLKHKFIYVDKLRLDFPNYNLALGSSIHKALEFYLKEIWKSKGREKPTLESTVNAFMGPWEEEMARLKNVESFDVVKCHDTENLGVLLLREYYRYLYKSDIFPASFRPFHSLDDIPAVELEIRAPVINLKTGEVISNKYDLLGHVDLVAFFKDGVNVVDHKTSSRKYSDFKIKTSIQLLIYSYLYRYFAREGRFSFNKPTLKLTSQESSVGFNIMLKLKKPVLQFGYTKITDNDLDRLYLMVEMYEKMTDNNIYFPVNNSECSFCDFNNPHGSICKTWQKHGGFNNTPMKAVFAGLERKYAVKIKRPT